MFSFSFADRNRKFVYDINGKNGPEPLVLPKKIRDSGKETHELMHYPPVMLLPVLVGTFGILEP